ncbi:MAG TPA: hypothetical protein VH374_00330 [Polyangia bacterium]|jgi:hypothetical protein|nr:hypothetical protein [Polyangia bacterium]
MSLRTHSLSLTVSLLASLWLATPASAWARGNNAETTVAPGASLQAERRKLASDLDRANADIEQLKKKERGVRDDYRLRARMADAEAIARRLTEIDAQLGVARGGNVPSRAAPGWAPVAEPAVTDGPAELEARADMLTDQSRRLEAQAGTLSQRVSGLRSRMELRRRAGQLESDPFAPMEGSKRRLIAGVPGALSAPGPIVPKENAAGGSSSVPPATRTGNPTEMPASNGNTSVSAPGAMSSPPTVTPPAGSNSVQPEALPAGGAGVGRSLTPAPLPPTGPSGAGGGATGSLGDGGLLSSQLRDFLDPSALAAIRKLELAGNPVSNLEAMDRAAAALRERASKLQQQSNSLRERAHHTR